MVEEITDYEILEIAVRELAIEHGLFTAEDHRRFTEWAESIGPINGSQLVAKAWTDPAFKALALKDGVKACKEGLGLDWAEPTGFGTPSDYTNSIVLEDTPTLHHVIVCTLCSCYPRPILGMSPEWYRTTNYRRRLVRWPREVLAEFGLILPPEVEIRVEALKPEVPLHGPSGQAWRHRELDRGATRGDRDAGLHDWGRPPSARQDSGRSPDPQSPPPCPKLAAPRGRGMKPTSDVEVSRVTLLERAYGAKARSGMSLRRVTASPIPIRRGKPAWPACASVSRSAALFLHSIGAKPRTSLQIPSIAKFLRPSVGCSRWSTPCSAAGSWQRKNSPAECARSGRGLSRPRIFRHRGSTLDGGRLASRSRPRFQTCCLLIR